jgi:hypothetical protein
VNKEETADFSFINQYYTESILHAGFLFGSFFYSEDDGDMFL